MTQLDLHRVFDLQYQASRAQVDVPLLVRRERLLRMQKLLDEHGPVLAAAVQADFGMRSPRLTEMVELFVLRNLLKHTLRHLARWSGRQRVRTPLMLMPGRGWIERQPLGVVGVISPWNYPVQLALGPAITALAAGNRVMLKPSELTPHTSAQLAALVGQFFAPEEFAVIEGDVSIATQFSGLHFDHLLFTGSTAVGRRVAQAAAAHLTPTTLELGGKSPCIISTDCDLKEAALKIAHGKLVNAGQTCIAPDYVLLPRGQEAEFAEAFRTAARRLFPRFAGNPDYAAILTKRHLARLRQMLRQAQGMGAHVEWMEDGGAGQESADTAWGDAVERQMAPALVFNATSQMQLMQEEIFGPILPIKTYETLDEAIAYVNDHPRPLSLYFFEYDQKAIDKVLRETISGGVGINETMLHVAQSDLPFGGVGSSGMGHYHAREGFETFTKKKAVFYQSRINSTALLKPPFGSRIDFVLKMLLGK